MRKLRDEVFHEFITELKSFDLNRVENKLTLFLEGEVITLLQKNDIEMHPKKPLNLMLQSKP